MNTLVTQKILDAIGILTANFTAATTGIITASSHGLKNGDKVVLTTNDTLPAGLALATVYYVVLATTNTFELSTEVGPEGGSVAITDTGTGTHTFTMHDIGNAILVEDFRHLVLALNTTGSANFTIKVQGSTQHVLPDFSAAQSPTNKWDYVQIKDLEDASTIDGDTGVAASGTDINRHFEVNTNGLRWVNLILTAWIAGAITGTVKPFQN